MANITSATTSTMPVMPSYRPPTSPYHHQPVRPSVEQLVFAAQSTGSATAFRESDRSGSTPHTWTYSAPLSAPTSMTLQKRQVVLEIEVITVVNVIPKVKNHHSHDMSEWNELTGTPFSLFVSLLIRLLGFRLATRTPARSQSPSPSPRQPIR
jgi:hypothetical protein